MFGIILNKIVYLICQTTGKPLKKVNKMDKLIAKIETLENKRDAGVMTMDEETLFFRLVELAEKIIYKN